MSILDLTALSLARTTVEAAPRESPPSDPGAFDRAMSDARAELDRRRPSAASSAPAEGSKAKNRSPQDAEAQASKTPEASESSQSPEASSNGEAESAATDSQQDSDAAAKDEKDAPSESPSSSEPTDGGDAQEDSPPAVDGASPPPQVQPVVTAPASPQASEQAQSIELPAQASAARPQAAPPGQTVAHPPQATAARGEPHPSSVAPVEVPAGGAPTEPKAAPAAPASQAAPSIQTAPPADTLETESAAQNARPETSSKSGEPAQPAQAKSPALSAQPLQTDPEGRAEPSQDGVKPVSTQAATAQHAGAVRPQVDSTAGQHAAEGSDQTASSASLEDPLRAVQPSQSFGQQGESSSQGEERPQSGPAAHGVFANVSVETVEVEAETGSDKSSTPTVRVERPAAPQPAALAGAAESEAGDENASARRVADQAVRALRSVVNQRGGSVTLKLHPEELGAMRVRVELMQHTVRAHFEVANESVRAMLQQQLHTLKGALEGQGLQVDQLQIQTQPGSHSQGAGAESDSDDGRSRGSFEQSAHGGGGSQDDSSGQQGGEQPKDFEQALFDLIG